jgi:PhnB protein
MGPRLIPYLNFDGNAAEAMKFYQSILGGELKMQTFGEAKMAKSPKDEKRIIHADLQNGDLSFMASDTMPGQKADFGNNVHMSISGQDRDGLARIFNGLAKGGKVDMPLAKQFWGDTYGALTDRFGVHWMVNIGQAQQ